MYMSAKIGVPYVVTYTYICITSSVTGRAGREGMSEGSEPGTAPEVTGPSLFWNIFGFNSCGWMIRLVIYFLLLIV